MLLGMGGFKSTSGIRHQDLSLPPLSLCLFLPLSLPLSLQIRMYILATPAAPHLPTSMLTAIMFPDMIITVSKAPIKCFPL